MYEAFIVIFLIVCYSAIGITSAILIKAAYQLPKWSIRIQVGIMLFILAGILVFCTKLAHQAILSL